nr:protein RRP6-like 3 [Tanacetum cinerariifolium]
VFVEAINPQFLPAGWDVTHSGRREFGDFSVYNPANKGSPSAAKDLTV